MVNGPAYSRSQSVDAGQECLARRGDGAVEASPSLLYLHCEFVERTVEKSKQHRLISIG